MLTEEKSITPWHGNVFPPSNEAKNPCPDTGRMSPGHVEGVASVHEGTSTKWNAATTRFNGLVGF
jgi:hypothetical protein